MTNEERIAKLRKFTADPDWALMSELLLGHLAPLRDITSIDAKQTNDQIASEVRGRQLTISGLEKFLNDANVINGNIKKTNTTFK